jgi:hypothetical protein
MASFDFRRHPPHLIAMTKLGHFQRFTAHSGQLAART